MRKISCLVVDDEPNAVMLLEDHIAKIPSLELKHKCYDAFEALSFLRNNTADLIFLDINMPKLSGMELAAILPPGQMIVLATAHSEFALEAYDYNVIDYLLKPVTFKRFIQAVSKVEALFKNNNYIPEAAVNQPEDYMFVKSGKRVASLE